MNKIDMIPTENLLKSIDDEKPIDMVLYCPKCGTQHIDSEIDNLEWNNPPHRSHLCCNCSYVWRPADVPTNGVLTIKTKGKNDSESFSKKDTNSARLAVPEDIDQWKACPMTYDNGELGCDDDWAIVAEGVYIARNLFKDDALFIVDRCNTKHK